MNFASLKISVLSAFSYRENGWGFRLPPPSLSTALAKFRILKIHTYIDYRVASKIVMKRLGQFDMNFQLLYTSDN